MSTAACSQCGAALRQDQAWCSLCLAGVPDAFDPLTAPLEELASLGERPVSAASPVPAPTPEPEPLPAPTPEPVTTSASTAPSAPAPSVPAPTTRGRHSADTGADTSAYTGVDTGTDTGALEPDQGRLWQPPSWMSVPDSDVMPVSNTSAEDDEAAEVTDIDVMFSMLSAEHRAMDRTSAITARMDDKSARVAIMIGGGLVIGAVLFLALTVLGAIF